MVARLLQMLDPVLNASSDGTEWVQDAFFVLQENKKSKDKTTVKKSHSMYVDFLMTPMSSSGSSSATSTIAELSLDSSNDDPIDAIFADQESSSISKVYEVAPLWEEETKERSQTLRAKRLTKDISCESPTRATAAKKRHRAKLSSLTGLNLMTAENKEKSTSSGDFEIAGDIFKKSEPAVTRPSAVAKDTGRGVEAKKRGHNRNRTMGNMSQDMSFLWLKETPVQYNGAKLAPKNTDVKEAFDMSLIMANSSLATCSKSLIPAVAMPKPMTINTTKHHRRLRSIQIC